MEIDQQVVDVYCAAVKVVEEFLLEKRNIKPYSKAAREAANHDARQLIARLAGNEPPLLICTEDELTADGVEEYQKAVRNGR